MACNLLQDTSRCQFNPKNECLSIDARFISFCFGQFPPKKLKEAEKLMYIQCAEEVNKF